MMGKKAAGRTKRDTMNNANHHRTQLLPQPQVSQKWEKTQRVPKLPLQQLRTPIGKRS
jgi:hypothetical protein